MKKLFLAGLFLASGFFSRAEFKAWEYVYCSSISGQQFKNIVGVDCALDLNGFVYEIGCGDYTHDGYSDKDVVLAKFDSLGNILGDKVISLNGFSNDIPVTVKVDKSTGRIYVLSNCTPKDSSSFSIIYCFDDSLNQLWSNEYHINGGVDQQARDMAIDPTGRVYTVGSYTLLNQGKNIFIHRVKPSNLSVTNKIYNNLNATTDEEPFKIICNADTTIFVLGYQVKTGKGKEFLLLKYNSVFAKIFQAPFNLSPASNVDDVPEDLVISPANDIYVTGRSFVSMANAFQMVTVKYNATGQKQWSRVYTGSETGHQVIYNYDHVYVSCDSFKLISYSPAGVLEKEFTSNGVAIADFKVDFYGDLVAVGKSDTVYLGVSTYQAYMSRWDTAGVQQYERTLPAFYKNGVGYASEYLKIKPIASGWYVMGKRYRRNTVFNGYCMKLQLFTYQNPRLFSGSIDNSSAKMQVNPNPAKDFASVKFILPENQDVEITVYNLLGKKIKSFTYNALAAGEHTLLWDLNDESGLKVSDDIYLIKLKTINDDLTCKVIVIK